MERRVYELLVNAKLSRNIFGFLSGFSLEGLENSLMQTATTHANYPSEEDVRGKPNQSTRRRDRASISLLMALYVNQNDWGRRVQTK
jgi:hypothetical protein